MKGNSPRRRVEVTGKNPVCARSARGAIRISTASGFTLIELLVAITIIAVLAAVLLPALVRAKAHSRSVRCKSNLRQMGLALRMYVDDHHVYPGGINFNQLNEAQFWWNDLTPYHQIQWTNRAFHCPAYSGEISEYAMPMGSGSYSYNTYGTGSQSLGLGFNPLFRAWDGYTWLTIRESQVRVPCDMFALADARILTMTAISGVDGSKIKFAVGHPFMYDYVIPHNGEIELFRHGPSFNFLYCDGHVNLVKRSVFMNRSNSWQNWNNDHQPHKETWP